MSSVTILIPGRPVPKARHRSAVVAGHVRTYDPQQGTSDWSRLASYFHQARLTQLTAPMDGPVRVTVRVTIGAPKRIRIKRNEAALADGGIPCDTRPDLDNYLKTLLDLGNTYSLWHDDGQVAEVRMVKVWSTEAWTRFDAETIAAEEARP